MNPNLDPKHSALLNKLANKDKTVVERIRKVVLQNEWDEFEAWEYVDEIRKIIKSKVKKMSKKQLLEYWEDFYDADLDIVPKKTLKTLTEKEKKFLYTTD